MKKGSHHSPETRAKMRQAALHQPPSAETREKLSRSLRGRPFSPTHGEAVRLAALRPERREKIRQARLRNWQDPEYRGRMIAARRRRPGHTPETREKVRQTRAHWTPEMAARWLAAFTVAQRRRFDKRRIALWGHAWLRQHNGRWEVRLFGTWMLRSWVVWIQHHGPIPRETDGKQYHIHHCNDDKLDDDPNNLQALTHSEHQRLHVRRRAPETREKLKQAQLGRRASPETREKLRVAWQRRRQGDRGAAQDN